jgi:hydroxymethylbilane synthase
MESIIIGTRGSELAMWQTKTVSRLLTEKTSIPTELKIIKTVGDRIDTVPFSKMEGKGFFTKELEEELLAGRIDIAVHSMKDLQTILPEGLALGAICCRDDPREVVLINPDSYDQTEPLGIKAGQVIGTSSVRRQCQISALMPGLQINDLRGNVPTRLRKLRDGQYDAIIIARAGVVRLGIDTSDLRSRVLDPDVFMPAPAQGIIAVEIRHREDDVKRAVLAIDDPDLRAQIRLERGLLAEFEGGCQLPLGAISEIDGRNYTLKAILGCRKGESWERAKRAKATGTDPELIVSDVYRQLTERST